MTSAQVLIRPVLSEKATQMGEPGPEAAKRGPTYTFEVAVGANKHQVRRAVEVQFAVAVAGVHTLIVPGKARRRGARVYRRPARKKAMVQLRAGQSLDLFAQEG